VQLFITLTHAAAEVVVESPAVAAYPQAVAESLRAVVAFPPVVVGSLREVVGSLRAEEVSRLAAASPRPHWPAPFSSS
jgi:hypothetical protein